MAVVERTRSGGKSVYFVVTSDRGAKYWERVGHDKRDAHRLNERRKKEVKAGTFVPPTSRESSVRTYLESWMARRTNVSAETERMLLRGYVLVDEREWLLSMKLGAVRPRHIRLLVDQLKLTPLVSSPDKLMSAKTVGYVYTVVRMAFRDAEFDELIDLSPCKLPKGTIKRRSQKERLAYTVEDAGTIVWSAGSPLRLVWNALALYTGMREGEVCGRRWSDWDPEAKPLGGLAVRTQYNDLPLKTDRARVVPVHPELAAILTWWRSEGFEVLFGRKPEPSDWIVPNYRKVGLCQTRRAAYGAWRRGLEAMGVDNRSLHSTRHTFVTHARRNGARDDVLEVVTHNSRAKMIDVYTHWEWAPLCEAVACFPNILVRQPVDDWRKGIVSQLLDMEGSMGHGKANHSESSGNAEHTAKTKVVQLADWSRRIAKTEAEVCAVYPGLRFARRELAARDLDDEATEVAVLFMERVS